MNRRLLDESREMDRLRDRIAELEDDRKNHDDDIADREDVILGFFWLMENQHLQRNTTHDGDPDWAPRVMRFTMWLSKAAKLVEGRTECPPK